MRRAPLLALSAACLLGAAGPGCGDDGQPGAPDASPADAAVDVPDDPFAGRFDGPEDFPRTGCRAGSLAGFSDTGLYPTLSLRLAAGGAGLRAFLGDVFGEAEVTPVLTDDALVVRRAQYLPGVGVWILHAIHVCDVPIPGVLRGHEVFCFEDQCGTQRVDATVFRRLAGEAEGDGLTLLGELALPRPADDAVPINVRVEGDVAYLAMGTDGLRTVTLANPRAPALLGHYRPATPSLLNDVKLLTVAGRRYAVVAATPSEVIDVTVPSAPQLVAQLPVSAHTLFVEGTHAYLVDSESPRLWIYDLADPRAPARRAEWTAPGVEDGGFHDLHVRGGIAYLSTFFYGITIADVHDPAAPRLLGASPPDVSGRFWHSPWATEIGGRTLVLNGDEGPFPQLRILDADPASPTFLGTVGTWSIPGPISMHNVMAIGDRAYMTHYQHGVRVLDLAAPATPRPLGYFNTWREADAIAAPYAGAIGLDLDPARRRIYVADTRRGLLVLEASAALMP